MCSGYIPIYQEEWKKTRYTSDTPPTTYNYTGQRLDGGTGLLYYGARFYDPALMRFVQADTLVPEPGNPQSLNRYAYVLNNPLKYTDPTGYYVYEGGYTDNYDPTRHSYTVPNTAGLIGAEVWFLGPGDAKLLYGTETPMRVAMWRVVATNDQPAALVNQGTLAAAVAMAAAVPRNQGPSGISGIAAPEGIGADPWETGSWRQLPLPEGDLTVRVQELHRLLDPIAQNRRTTAIVRTVGPDGKIVSIVASSEPGLAPIQRAALRPGEIEATGPGHAEITALRRASELSLQPLEVAASRPICPDCAWAIYQVGAIPISPLKLKSIE